jgi:NADP+-dependent farnesol dehydrogenase
MERWKGKIAVVTGASVGIGEAIVKELAKNGLIVIGLARRAEKIEEYAKVSSGEIHAYKCDISDANSIKAAFKWIEDKFGVIHILVNNAGILKKITILGDSSVSEEVTDVINTNFTGLVICANEAFRLIKKSDDYGMIININSNAGHRIFFPPTGLSHNVYPGTKFAVTATSEVLRQELIHQKNDKVRVTVSIELTDWLKPEMANYM